MSLKRLVGTGSLSLYAGVAGVNSLSAYQEYHHQREIIFREFISDHVKNKGDLGIYPAYEDTHRIMNHIDDTNYLLAVNVGEPTSITAGLFAVYLLFGKRKKED